jgi:hypothetical protein
VFPYPFRSICDFDQHETELFHPVLHLRKTGGEIDHFAELIDTGEMAIVSEP